MERRQEKLGSVLQDLIAKYLNSQSNRSSMITVTKVAVSPDGARATAFISIFPEEREEEALAFIRRKRADMREYVKGRIQAKRLPVLDVALDLSSKFSLEE